MIADQRQAMSTMKLNFKSKLDSLNQTSNENKYKLIKIWLRDFS